MKYYKVEPYYNAETIQDLVGVLLIGLAPHTSAGVLRRLIGFTKASVGYAHPFFMLQNAGTVMEMKIA